MTSGSQSRYADDLEQTRRNRDALRDNVNLLYWYEQLYRQVLGPPEVVAGRQVLEIGSGTSPLKVYCPSVQTSDVLALDYLDHVFDCHQIDSYGGIPDYSVDTMLLVNALHHLRDPIDFLARATRKLKPGGEVILIEPFFSVLSNPLYRVFHHEPVNFATDFPGLGAVDGPLSSSNQAVPHMIFFSRPDWRARLAGHYELDKVEISFFTSLSYMITGGISRRFPIPHRFYRAFFRFDRKLSNLAPSIFASFFIARLRRPQQVRTTTPAERLQR